MKPIAFKAKDRVPCPNCGENWLYGWYAFPSGQIAGNWKRPDLSLSPTKLKIFLAEKEKWKCSKCGEEFPKKDN